MPLACAGSSFVAPHHLDRAIGSSLRGFRRGGSVTAPKLGVGHARLHQASGAHGGERPSARIVAGASDHMEASCALRQAGPGAAANPGTAGSRRAQRRD